MRSIVLVASALVLAAPPGTPRAGESVAAPSEAPLAASAGSTVRPGEIFAVGDSVMLGAREHLLALPGWSVTVEAAVCRQATHTVPGPVTCAGTSFPEGITSGLAVLREARAQERLGHVVVLMLGSNEGITEPQFEELMLDLRDVPRVLWITNTVRWQRKTNEVLRAGVQRHPNAAVLDWAAHSRGKPWFGKDRIHLNRAGRKAFAELVANGLPSSAAAGAQAAPPADPCCAGQERSARSQ